MQLNKYFISFVFSFMLIQMFISLGHCQIINIESLRMEENSRTITGKMGFSMSLSHSDFTLLNIKTSSHLQFQFSFGTLLAIGDLSLLLQDKEELTDKTTVHLRYNHHLTRNISPEIYTQIQYDVIKDLDRRILWGGGIRWIPIKSSYTKWIIGGGGFHETERLQNSDHSTTMFRLSNYIAGNILFSKYTKINIITYFQPISNLKTNDWRLSGIYSIQQRITKSISIQSTFALAYDSKPPKDIEKLSYDWFNGISIQF